MENKRPSGTHVNTNRFTNKVYKVMTPVTKACTRKFVVIAKKFEVIAWTAYKGQKVQQKIEILTRCIHD